MNSTEPPRLQRVHNNTLQWKILSEICILISFISQAHFRIISNVLISFIYPDVALIVGDPINSSITQFPWLLR